MFEKPSVPSVHVDRVPAEVPEDVTVLDVREQEEWDAGHISGARHVPLAELPHRVDELPSDDRLLVVCKVGGRSAEATSFLRQHGRNAVNLDGGVLAWSRAGRPLVTPAGAPGSVMG
jgi:rhodanese-related sulfurtransferase